MTLIAQIYVDGIPVVLGDLLVTGAKKSTKKVRLPSSDCFNEEILTKRRVHIKGLVQKINILSDRLVVCFSGDGEQARDVAEIFGTIANSSSLDEELLIKTFDTIELNRKDRLQGFGILTTPSEDDPDLFKYEIFRFGVDKKFCGSFGLSTIAGSGERQFLQILEQLNSCVGNLIQTSEDKYQNAEKLCSGISCSIIGQEFLDGHNLLEKWGGGIETLSFRNGAFTKTNNTIYLFWRFVETKKGGGSLILEPRFLKYEYWDDLLLIRTVEIINRKGQKIQRDEIDIVTPVLADCDNIDFSKIPAINFNCTTLSSFVVIENEVDCLVHVKFDSNGLDLFKYTNENGKCVISVHGSLIDELISLISNRSGIKIEHDMIDVVTY